MQKIIMTVGFVVLASTVSAGEEKEKKPTKDTPEYVYDCKSDREFITTYEFLRKRTEFGLNPPEMRNVALSVADGCTGAARHFIEITELLLKARLDGKTAMKTGIEVAAKGETSSIAFVKIFKNAFAKEMFDLDAGTSTRMAKELSLEFKGDPEIAGDDFEKLAKFCTSDLGKGLAKNKCAAMMQAIITANAEGKLPVADAFRDAFTFLTNRNETNLTPADAFGVAEKLVSASPEAVPAFRHAYEYALDPAGLGLPRGDAVKFATAVAVKTKRPKAL